MRTNTFAFPLLAALSIACTVDEVNTQVDCSGTSVTFTEVNTIFQSSCAANSGCHGTGSRNGPGELKTYSQINSARTSIRTAVASGTMPQGARLSSDDKNAILCWIENGAANN